MDTTVVELDPVEENRPSRRGLVLVAGLVLLSIAAAVTWLALRDRPSNDDVPYYRPTYLPADFHTTIA